MIAPRNQAIDPTFEAANRSAAGDGRDGFEERRIVHQKLQRAGHRSLFATELGADAVVNAIPERGVIEAIQQDVQKGRFDEALELQITLSLKLAARSGEVVARAVDEGSRPSEAN